MKTSNKKYEAIITSRVSISNDIELENLNIELPPIHIELKPLDLAPLPPQHEELKPLEFDPLPPVHEELKPLKLDPLPPSHQKQTKDLHTMVKGHFARYYKYQLSERIRAGIARKKLLGMYKNKTTLPVKKSKV